MTTEVFLGAVNRDRLALEVKTDGLRSCFAAMIWGFNITRNPNGSTTIYINYLTFDKRFMYTVTNDPATAFSVYDVQAGVTNIYTNDRMMDLARYFNSII